VAETLNEVSSQGCNLPKKLPSPCSHIKRCPHLLEHKIRDKAYALESLFLVDLKCDSVASLSTYIVDLNCEVYLASWPLNHCSDYQWSA
jgi:hypothetical protein